MPARVRRSIRHSLLAFALPFLHAAPAGAQGDADPLFSSIDVLPLRIAAPLETLMEERPDEEELASTASWTEADGREITVDVDIRTRGNYRRQEDVCPFAPLRLDFKKKQVKDTLFDGQDKLKLVTHCKTGSQRSAQFLLREYLAYRMFNTLTDLSYRVRLLQVTWENTEKEGETFVAPAFLVEPDDRLGERVGLVPAALPNTTVDRLDPAYTGLAGLFHYYLGNTDFSPVLGPAGDNCCHNSTLFGSEDGLLFPVPYDFDMSGMVNADYASPNPRFRLRNVQSRLYRGRCPHNDQLPAAIALFEEHRDALYALVDGMAELQSRSRKDMRDFMDDFFETIADPAEVQEEITSMCVPLVDREQARSPASPRGSSLRVGG